MNANPASGIVSALAVALLAGAAGPAAAQSGAGLLLKPWEEGTNTELHGGALLQGESETDDDRGDDFELRWYEGVGRHRVSEDRGAPTVGFDFQHIDLRTSHPALPEELVDQSVGVGLGVGEFDDWGVGLTLGGGYAGDNPYGADDAWYARANLVFSNRLDPDSRLLLILNYNGNRSVWPDVPLPGIAYTHRHSDRLRYTAGLPYSSLTWQPSEPLTLNVQYSIPYTVNLTAEWEVVEGVALIGAFQNRFNAYHLEEMREHRRLFFQHRRIEGGARWTPSERFDLTAAVGYAFDQEFERGFDTIDSEPVVEVDAAPYIRLAFNLRF